ncbi:hypothetical protein F2Q70_00015631 [Brassica cretica]|uniref:Uncharacterized protein n=1 Tax=Brassica cretica TaxID=69181 RepID=A0A8S9HPH3_BRACR|nr:hypothetical protein F2Q70_00015631 [Brassica cretica]
MGRKSPTSCIKLEESFDHVKSLFQSKHHRHGHLYSCLTLQLDHHRQLYEVVKVYQFVQWPVTNCRRSLLCIPRPTGNGGLAYIGGYLCVRFECEEQGDIFWLIGGEFQDGKDLNNKYDDCVFN